MPYKPGQSGNPKGRPRKGTAWADMIKKVSQETSPIRRMTRMRSVVVNMFEIAEDKGHINAIQAANWLRDTLDGRPTQRVAGPDGEGPMQLNHGLSPEAESIIAAALEGLCDQNVPVTIEHDAIGSSEDAPLALECAANAEVDAFVNAVCADDEADETQPNEV